MHGYCIACDQEPWPMEFSYRMESWGTGTAELKIPLCYKHAGLLNGASLTQTVSNHLKELEHGSTRPQDS